MTENTPATPSPHPDVEQFAVPDMPIVMASALREGVEYVDATALLTETLAHAKKLHDLTHLVANSLAATQQSLIRAHKQLIEHSADIGSLLSGQQGSNLILPDHMRN